MFGSIQHGAIQRELLLHFFFVLLVCSVFDKPPQFMYLPTKSERWRTCELTSPQHAPALSMALAGVVSVLLASLSVQRPVVLQPRRSLSSARRAAPCFMQEDGVTCNMRKQPKSAVALDISIPASVAQSVYDQVLGELSRNANVPGFRPGNAPTAAVINKIGNEKLKEATVEQLVDVGMKQSGKQVQLNTVGQAVLVEELSDMAKSYTIGEPISFTVMIDVYPEVPLEDDIYTGLEASVERVPFNQDAYDAALLKLRDQHADLVEADDGTPCEAGQQLLINMVGYHSLNGERGDKLPDVAGGEGVQLPLRSGKFMPGLVEGLIGIKRGESRDITVTFPARTSVPELSGIEAIFDVKCEKVQSRVLPECTDEFAGKVRTGMSWKELDDKLREGVEQECEAQQRKMTHRAIEQALLKKLTETFEVPETLIEQVSKERFAQMLGDMRERGTPDEQLQEFITKENYERYLKIARPQSEMQVKLDFSLKEISRQQGLTVDRDLVDDEVMTLQAQTLQRGEKFKEAEVRPKVAASLERGMVLDWLAAEATVELLEPGTADEEKMAEELLGANPEELAKQVMEDERLKAAAEADKEE